MRIKHFAGYSSVEAKKIRKTKFRDEYDRELIRLKILVWGNHEWGIERNDQYDIYNWLVKRFAPDCPGYLYIESMDVNDYYSKREVNGVMLDVEHCEYTIVYRTTQY